MGLKQGVDVSIYDNKEHDSFAMREIRLALKTGYYTPILSDTRFCGEQIAIMKLGLVEEVDIEKYADPKFSSEQMNQILEGLLSEVDVDLYLDESYTSLQMRRLRLGMEKGLDVSAYADPKINAFEMGLSLDFDIMKKELENETKEDEVFEL